MTDLFCEASDPYHHTLDIPSNRRLIGIDHNRRVIPRVKRRQQSEGKMLLSKVDVVRHLPLADEVMTLAVALSALVPYLLVEYGVDYILRLKPYRTSEAIPAFRYYYSSGIGEVETTGLGEEWQAQPQLLEGSDCIWLVIS